jgi:hypothetical protein
MRLYFALLFVLIVVAGFAAERIVAVTHFPKDLPHTIPGMAHTGERTATTGLGR